MSQLKREIRRWDLVLLLINSIVGAGIFGLPSKIYALSGFYSIPALFVCAAVVFILVLNFAEVASRFDKTGGPYLYTLTAFGKIPAFIIGWLLLITRISTYAALINLLVTYLGYFYAPFIGSAQRFGLIICITLALTWINYWGVKQSAKFSNIMAIAKLVPLTIFIIWGMFFIKPEWIDFHQPMPNLPDFSSSVLILIFAFTGFEAVLVNTGEIQDPRKNIPFALIVSILFVAVFYGLIQVVNMGTLSTLATSSKPITDAAQLFMGPFGAILITLGAIVSIGGTLNSVMLIGSRVPFALSEADQFPKIFSRLHPRFSTPIYSLFAFSAITLIASLSGSFIYAVSISVISKILIFMVVCSALIKLRKQDRPGASFYKIPYGYLFAILGILASLWLLFSSKSTELVDVAVTILVGIVLYIVFKVVSRKQQKKTW